MQISARNQLPGTIKGITLGVVAAEVVVDVAGYEVVSVVTRSSVEGMGLKVGNPILVVIKATEVILARDA
jgi:molybdopterin-binding protein